MYPGERREPQRESVRRWFTGVALVTTSVRIDVKTSVLNHFWVVWSVERDVAAVVEGPVVRGSPNAIGKPVW